MTDAAIKPKKKSGKPGTTFQLPDGTAVQYPNKGENKFFRDIIRYHNGAKAFEKTEIVVVPDALRPIDGQPLVAQASSPICAKCGLDQNGPKHPYMEYVGAENPVATIIVESISLKEDDRGSIGAGGLNSWMAALVHKLQHEHGVSLSEIRWVPITRCASRLDKKPNYKTKGNWCRHYAIQDLMTHPPKVVIPVGTAALGLLSHKSNAGDWSGRLLTWRGWPDDWLTDPAYVLDRPDPLNSEKMVRGHPLYGPVPNVRISMVPLQNPGLILAYQNELLYDRWKEDLTYALQVGKKIIPPPEYNRFWYRITSDPEEIIATLEKACAFAEADPNFIVAYDTETTGLKQWAHFKRVKPATGTQNQSYGAPAIKADDESEDEIIRSAGNRIVFMMFRWTNPENGEPESIGFPWDYETSETLPHLERITPHVIRLLALAQIAGHNLTFDVLFTVATVGKRKDEHIPFNPDGSWNESWLRLQDRINLLSEAARWDTWHMAFTALQKRGSLSLDILAYDWVPDLAGYEEDMTLMIDLYGDSMNPANGKGGHYANCPKQHWETHLKPYVMGDAEVTYQARERLAMRLQKTKVYKIPLSAPGSRGFRYYTCPNRDWVYQNIVSPASRTLTKMMARGMYIDPNELTKQEKEYPEKVHAAKLNLRKTDEVIERWCQTKIDEAAKKKDENPDASATEWELDLENKSQLKELLFDVLHCDIIRMTKNGRKLYGEDPADWQHLTYQEQKSFAAVDKYTLNRLAVDHPNLRPLQEYRKVFKLYSTYVRPMRNIMSAKLDKKQRVKEPHLSVDQCIHASFLLTGTRSGRLCVAGDTQLEIRVDGQQKTVDISDLWIYNKQHVTVKTHKGRQKKIIRVYYKGREPMFLAVTTGGSQIKATGGHRILTRRGWVAVRDLTGSDEIRVDISSRSRSHTKPGLLYPAGSGRKTGFSMDQRENFKTSGFAKLESLPGAKNTIEGITPSASRRHQSGKQKRVKSAISNVSRKPIGRDGKTRHSSGTDGTIAGHNAIFNQTEYAGVWIAEIGQRTSQSESDDKASNSRNRSELSGPVKSVCLLLQKQRSIFPQSLPGLFDLAGTSLVSERHVPGTVPGAQGTFWRHGRNLMVNEPIRIGALPGAYFIENTALPGICLQRKSKGGFRLNRNKYSDRDRRRISHSRTDFGINTPGGKSGIPNSPLLDETGALQNSRCNFGNTDCFEKLLCLRPAGEEEVWDIEVEDDHSYLAQGLFHHNSSRDPNLQQLPNEGLVKKVFTSRFRERGCIYSADLSQIELRLMAAACGDKTMIQAYLDDVDIHSLTASKIYRVPYETFTKKHMEDLQKKNKSDEAKKLELQRKIAKTTNFLTGYGGGAFGLQNVLANNEVYMTIEECEEIIISFFEAYPALKRFLGVYKTFIEENGVAVSMFGRVRQFEEVFGEDREASSKALRAGCNHLIQSTASDMMLICLFTIEALMRDANLNSLLVSTVHDSLVIDAVREELPEVHAIVNGVMNDIPGVIRATLPDYDTSWMVVPFAGDSEVGVNYLEGSKISGENPDWDKLLQPKKKAA